MPQLDSEGEREVEGEMVGVEDTEGELDTVKLPPFVAVTLCVLRGVREEVREGDMVVVRDLQFVPVGKREGERVRLGVPVAQTVGRRVLAVVGERVGAAREGDALPDTLALGEPEAEGLPEAETDGDEEPLTLAHKVAAGVVVGQKLEDPVTEAVLLLVEHWLADLERLLLGVTDGSPERDLEFRAVTLKEVVGVGVVATLPETLGVVDTLKDPLLVSPRVFGAEGLWLPLEEGLEDMDGDGLPVMEGDPEEERLEKDVAVEHTVVAGVGEEEREGEMEADFERELEVVPFPPTPSRKEGEATRDSVREPESV